MGNNGGVAAFTTVLGISAPAKAVVFDTYTDRANWESAVAGQGLSFTEEDFNSFTQDESFAASSFNVGDFSLSASNGSSSFNYINDIDAGNISAGTTNNIDGTNYVRGRKFGSNTFSVTFDSPIKAFGWEYNDMAGEGWEIQGNNFTLPAAGNTDGTGSFFGVVNTDVDSFTTVNLIGGNNGFGLDNFVYSSDVASTSVPFEFSPALGLLAVGGFFGFKYLRKKRATKIDEV